MTQKESLFAGAIVSLTGGALFSLIQDLSVAFLFGAAGALGGYAAKCVVQWIRNRREKCKLRRKDHK